VSTVATSKPPPHSVSPVVTQTARTDASGAHAGWTLVIVAIVEAAHETFGV